MALNFSEEEDQNFRSTVATEKFIEKNPIEEVHRFQFVTPENREGIVINGLEVDLLDLTKISDNIDKEMRELPNLYGTLHEILTAIGETITGLEQEKKEKIGKLTAFLASKKAEDKSLTDPTIKALIESNPEIVKINKEVSTWELRKNRLHGIMSALMIKKDMLRELGSRQAYNMQTQQLQTTIRGE